MPQTIWTLADYVDHHKCPHLWDDKAGVYRFENGALLNHLSGVHMDPSPEGVQRYWEARVEIAQKEADHLHSLCVTQSEWARMGCGPPASEAQLDALAAAKDALYAAQDFLLKAQVERPRDPRRDEVAAARQAARERGQKTLDLLRNI
jgi:hypothetical protein